MPKPAVELNIALEAISADLDAMADEIATAAGQVAQLSQGQQEHKLALTKIDHKLDQLLDIFRQLPTRSDVDNLRKRIAYLENPSLVRPEGFDAE